MSDPLEQSEGQLALGAFWVWLREEVASPGEGEIRWAVAEQLEFWRFLPE